ncbi:hypothetical protein ES332_D10G094100v1 [Gossypium tomentosum]|uniref:Uncharacterized protein n=1 Tax=Gossypium tomentosum TaxID=34277 RepID=A0A5D2J300_GOSTO|nr:hypothetical protein ES332_D10G094100v1 [Gossypium tomentosum]
MGGLVWVSSVVVLVSNLILSVCFFSSTSKERMTSCWRLSEMPEFLFLSLQASDGYFVSFSSSCMFSFGRGRLFICGWVFFLILSVFHLGLVCFLCCFSFLYF